VEALVEKWLLPLNVRQIRVLRWRYGLDGRRLTLEEIGRQLGVTRERVRQIQERALYILEKRPSRDVIQPLKALLAYLLERAGGLVNEAQVELALQHESVIGNVNPAGVAHLVFQVSGDVRWLRKTKAWGLESCPLDEVEKVQRDLVQVLKREHAPLPVDEVIARFKTGRLYGSRQDALKDSFVIACLQVHPDIVVGEDSSCGLKKWERSCIDEIVLALRGIGEPAHYGAIAEEANELLAQEMRTSLHDIHAVLLRRTDLFVRVGQGIFGLKEWELPDDGNLANAAYRVLSEAGKPLHIGIITDRVLETWRVRRTSVHTAVDFDDRFVNIGRSVYWLRERMAEGAEVKETADFGDLFGKRLERWQVELGLCDRGASHDTHAEADAIRQVGLDFFG